MARLTTTRMDFVVRWQSWSHAYVAKAKFACFDWRCEFRFDVIAIAVAIAVAVAIAIAVVVAALIIQPAIAVS